MIDVMLLGFICGSWSFLWCRVLTVPGMAGNIAPKLYWRVFGVHKQWKAELSKPLFDCPICHSFWIGLVAIYFGEIEINHCFTIIVTSIFSAFALDKKYGESN